jgi:SAM-dependent methyltransferase
MVEAVRAVVNRRKRIVALSVKLLRKQYRGDGDVLKMVDVGCGDADKSRLILQDISDRQHLNIVPYGLELSNDLHRTALEVIKPYGGDVIHGTAIEAMAKLPDDSMNLILICSFLEHEVNPLELLISCRRKLTRSGYVLIKVPNFNSWNRIIRQNRWCGFRYPDHVNYFTPKTLRMIVEASGLEVARLNFFDRLPTNDNMYVIARIKG